MSTTKLHPEHTELGTVVGIDRAAQRRRLQRLLDTRFALAVLAGERISHHSTDAGETYALLLAVESELRNEFPEFYEEHFSEWWEQEAAAEHAADVLTPTCGICRAIARSRGLNVESPGAA